MAVIDYDIQDKSVPILCTAIIAKAARDYQMSLCGEKCNPYLNPKDTIRECECFFRSDWFLMLTEFNGDRLIRMLKKETEDYNYIWKDIKHAHGYIEQTD